MRKIMFAAILMSLFSASVCFAADDMTKKAYSYYFRGKMREAVETMKEASGNNPDAGQLYFIGYAYYKMGDYKNAKEYFNEAYKLNKEYNPKNKEKMVDAPITEPF